MEIYLILTLYPALGIFFDPNKTFAGSAAWSLYGFVFGFLASVALTGHRTAGAGSFGAVHC